MALEIRELIIRVTVHEDAAAPVALQGKGPRAIGGHELRRLRDELAQTCTRQVLAELRRRRER